MMRSSTSGTIRFCYESRGEKKGKKRELKMFFKNRRHAKRCQRDSKAAPRRNGSRPVLEGVSIFDLIIPWKDNTSKETKPKSTQKKTT